MVNFGPVKWTEEGRGMEENVALNGNWKATHVFYTNSRTRWHECALYIMQRPPFKRVCANTQEVANPENLNCNFVLYTFLAITLFALFFPSLFLCAVSNIFPIIFSLLSFFFIFPSPRFFVLLLFTVLFLSFFIIPWTRSNFAIRLSLVFLREQRKLRF